MNLSQPTFRYSSLILYSNLIKGLKTSILFPFQFNKLQVFSRLHSSPFPSFYSIPIFKKLSSSTPSRVTVFQSVDNWHRESFLFVLEDLIKYQKSPIKSNPNQDLNESSSGSTSPTLISNPTSPTSRSSDPTISNSSAVNPPSSNIPQRKGWKGYLSQFQSQPTSHLISFLLLHELTAILPLPLLYMGFTYFDVNFSIPVDSLSSYVSSVTKLLTWLKLDQISIWDSNSILKLATCYGIVKASLPIRLSLCVYWTPWFSRSIIVPLGRFGIFCGLNRFWNPSLWIQKLVSKK